MNRAGPWSVVTVDSPAPARTAAGIPIIAHPDWVRVFLGRAFAPSATVGAEGQPHSVEYLVLGRHVDLLLDERTRSSAARAAAADFEALAKIVGHHRDSIAAAMAGGVRARPELFIGGYAVLRRVTVPESPKDWVITDEGLSIVGWGLEGAGRRPVLAMDPSEIRALRDRVLAMHSLPCPSVGPTVGDRAVKRVRQAEAALERGSVPIDGAPAPKSIAAPRERASVSGPGSVASSSAGVRSPAPPARWPKVAAVVGAAAAIGFGALAIAAVARSRAAVARVVELEASVSSMQAGSDSAAARSRELEGLLKLLGPLRSASQLVAEVRQENDGQARRLLDAKLRELEPARRPFPGIDELGTAALEALDRLSKCSEQVNALKADREALEGRLGASSSSADEARQARALSFRIALDAVRQLPPGEARATAIESLLRLAVGPDEAAAVRSIREAATSPASAPAAPMPRAVPATSAPDAPALQSSRDPADAAPVPGTLEEVVSKSWLPADRGADAVSRASESLAHALDAGGHASSAARVRQCLEAGPGWPQRLERELTRVGESFPNTDEWKAFRKQVAGLASDPRAGSVGEGLRVLESLQLAIGSTSQLSRTATGSVPGLARIASTSLVVIGEALPECGGLRASVLGSQAVLGGLQSLPPRAEPSAVEVRKSECLRWLKPAEWRQQYENGMRERLRPWSVVRTRVGELVAGTAGASLRLRHGIRLPKTECPVYFFDDAAPEAFRRAGVLRADGSFVRDPDARLPSEPELALYQEADRATRP